MWTRLGISWTEAALVIVSAVAVYAVFTVLVRLLGQRTIARMTTFDVLVVLVLGSVAGRVITGYTPSLAAGVLGLVVLFVAHLAVQRIAFCRPWSRVLRGRPVLLMAAGVAVDEHLHRTGITPSDLRAVLRVKGIRSADDVACVVLEAAGELSVVQEGALLDRALFADVLGVELIPKRYFAGT